MCPGLFTERALNPWIIIIFFFSLSPSTESPSHICSAAISAAQTRIQCSFNNYFYLTPGQRTSIPMIPSKCWTLPRRQTENMTNNPRSGWRPFGCLLRDLMRDIMNIFIWSHSWQEKLFSVQCVAVFFEGWRFVLRRIHKGQKHMMCAKTAELCGYSLETDILELFAIFAKPLLFFASYLCWRL